jgi:hypothetical protein
MGANVGEEGAWWSDALLDKWHRNGALSCPTAMEWNDNPGSIFTGTFTLTGFIPFMKDQTIGLYPYRYQSKSIKTPDKFGVGFCCTSYTSVGVTTAPPHTTKTWAYGYIARTHGDQFYNQPGMFHFAKKDSWIWTRASSDRFCGFYRIGSTNVLYGDGRVESKRWADLIFGYDGTPHREPNGTAHAAPHETGKGLGDRKDRTWESMQFWLGDR